MQQFYPILIVMAITALSWLANRLKEQAQVKQARDEMARRRNEELRTGRAQVESSASSPTADAQAMQDLAARRQAQLRELRARQAQQQAQSGQGPPVIIAPTPVQRRPAPVQQGTLRPMPMPGTPRPVPAQRQTPRPQQQQQQRRPQTATSGVSQPVQRVQPIAASRRVVRAVEGIPETRLVQTSPGDRLLDLVRDRTTGKPDAARLIVLGEILGQPPSMRD